VVHGHSTHVAVVLLGGYLLVQAWPLIFVIGNSEAPEEEAPLLSLNYFGRLMI
jgi:hypothetical protein